MPPPLSSSVSSYGLKIGLRQPYETCSAQVTSGRLRETLDGLRTAYLNIKSTKLSLDDIPQRILNEVGANATINDAILTNSQDQSVYAFALALIESTSVSSNWSVTVSSSPGFSFGMSEELQSQFRTNSSNSQEWSLA